jgi:hypothetical protein
VINELLQLLLYFAKFFALKITDKRINLRGSAFTDGVGAVSD